VVKLVVGPERQAIEIAETWWRSPCRRRREGCRSSAWL